MLVNKQIIDMICFQEESKTGKVGLFGRKVPERAYKSGTGEQENQPKQPESARKGL